MRCRGIPPGHLLVDKPDGFPYAFPLSARQTYLKFLLERIHARRLRGLKPLLPGMAIGFRRQMIPGKMNDLRERGKDDHENITRILL